MEKTYKCATDPGDRARLTTGYIELAGLWVREGCNQCLVNLDRETARKLATDLHEWAGPVVRYPEPAVEPEPSQRTRDARRRETARQIATDMHEWAGPVTEPAVEPELYVLPPHPVWLATYREVLRANLRNGVTSLIAIAGARRAADESIK